MSFRHHWRLDCCRHPFTSPVCNGLQENILGPVFWQNGFFSDLYFRAAVLFLADLVVELFPSQARKKRWGGGLPLKGWGPKGLVCPSKQGKSNFCGGISDFARISRRSPKSLSKKKVCVQFLARTLVCCRQARPKLIGHRPLQGQIGPSCSKLASR